MLQNKINKKYSGIPNASEKNILLLHMKILYKQNAKKSLKLKIPYPTPSQNILSSAKPLVVRFYLFANSKYSSVTLFTL